MRHKLFRYYTYRTDQLNKAAFFLALGADVLDTQPHVGVICLFTMRTQHWMYLYERYVGWLPYKRYVQARRQLKMICKSCRLQPTNKIRFEGELKRHYGHK